MSAPALATCSEFIIVLGFSQRDRRSTPLRHFKLAVTPRRLAKIDAGKWNEVRDEALSAYRLRATEPESLRAVARYLSRTRQPPALDFWPQLGRLQPLTRDDLRDDPAKSTLPRSTASVRTISQNTT